MTQDPRTEARKSRKISRYQRIQERRAEQRKADQKFYNTIFTVVGVCVLVVLGLAMLASSSDFEAGGTNQTPAQILELTRFLGLTALEWGGLIVVGIIGIFMWRRISKR